MSDQPQPKAHPRILLDGGVHLAATKEGIAYGQEKLTPDEAVALGYALLEHGLYLKGKMK